MRRPAWLALIAGLALATGVGFAKASSAPPAEPVVVAPDLASLEALKRKSDWAGLELLARQALTVSNAATPARGADIASAEAYLGDALLGQARQDAAADAYRKAASLREAALGVDHPDTLASLNDLGTALIVGGRLAEAAPLFTRVLVAGRRTEGPNGPLVALAENSLGKLLRLQGRYGEADTHFRRALAIREQVAGPDHPDTAISLTNLAMNLWSLGRPSDAEPLIRRALTISEKTASPDARVTEQRINQLGLIVQDEGRLAEAETLFRRALAAAEKGQGAQHPDVARDLTNLGSVLWDEGRRDEVEPLFRRALEINAASLGPEHSETALSLNNLAFVLEARGQAADAEPLYRRALAIDQKVLGPDHTAVALVTSSIAELLRDQGRFAEAETLFRQAARVNEKALGVSHPDTSEAYQSLADTEAHQSNFGAATADYRQACSARAARAGVAERIGEAATEAKVRSSGCSTRLALSLFGWATLGGGKSAGDRPAPLREEAFLATQRATLSAAGEAMARSAALATAVAAGVGAEATAYEDALVERDRIDLKYAAAAGVSGEAGATQRTDLAARRAEVLARIAALAAGLRTKAPRYWDYRAPAPVDLAALQTLTGPDAALLWADEALLVFLTPPGQDRGLVFAVSKTRIAWARIGMTGEELKARVTAVRTPIERRYRAFNRQAAYDLYVALLGDPAIQTVIGDKATLLFVPTGPLTSLPPGLLVTAPPEGGALMDSDPSALRATPWLLRDKAVALLPTVSSLRTLRQLTPAARSATSDPLLAFADPDFVGAAAESPAPETTAGPRGFSEYSRRGVAMAAALRTLPRLPGTRVEGEALMSALDGRPGSLLLGHNASKAELMARNADGRLAKVRVLEFATHGLVAGAASWLSEPALAMAAGSNPEDELLLASEASTLKLNADWVLLSACNTASPDGPDAQGLSGLSRAFFHAGARSLLVSHWPVRDDIAPRLIPAILLAERSDPHIDHAQSLRRASLAILDDVTMRAANPSAWAVFTLVGDARR